MNATRERPHTEAERTEIVGAVRAGARRGRRRGRSRRPCWCAIPDRLERALGVEDRCGITVLTTSPQLTVQRVVWPAGIRIPPHDHRMWAVVGVYRGREDNALFRRDGRALEPAGGRQARSRERSSCSTLTRSTPWRNTTARPCVALHVYGGDLDDTPRSTWTPDEQPFDPDGMWRAIARFRGREDELGRALRPEETEALLPRR